MRRFKKVHLMASDCEAFSHSREGSFSLTRPVGQAQTGRDFNRGLYPTYRTRRQQEGKGHQKTITSYFKTKHHTGDREAESCENQESEAKSHKVKEELEDPFFSDEELLSSLEEPSFLAGEAQSAEPASWEAAVSRKRPLLDGSGSCDAGYSIWGKPDEALRTDIFLPKPLGQNESQREIKQELDIDPLPDPCFGLLGTSSRTEPQGHIDQLPDEVLSHIFACLPVTDLYQSLSLVCHRWKCIIRDPLFIPWKKLYYQYLVKENPAVIAVEGILDRYGITKEQDQCMLGLIRYVSTLSSDRRVDSDKVLQCLKSHRLFTKAENCIANKLPDLKSTAGAAMAWAVIATIVLFSDAVRDIQKLMACLKRPCSTVSVMEVAERLYCLATLLYAMREKDIDISNRIHYNIFYYLYLMESSCSAVKIVEQPVPSSPCARDIWSRSKLDLKLTHEQQRILNHEIAPGHIVKIMAFAGTGKTSTLIKYAEKFSNLNFLYVAFNKSIVENGKKLFPCNVTCKTFHSLAFATFGKQYKEKGKLNFFKLSPYTISFQLKTREGQSLFVRGKTVTQTLESFFASSDEFISTEHTPIWCKNTHGMRVPVTEGEKRIIVEEARRIWDNMKALNRATETNCKITCDGYLKLWQLSKPRLLDYHAIFVDEAQDCTPAIMNVVLSQTCGVIFVGDPHQQIYTFRGAVNALVEVPHTHIYYLTRSFRFGPEIAYVGATILDVCKKVRNKTLVGGDQEGDIRGSMTGKIALISRGNLNVFEDAVKITGREQPTRIHLIGGLARFGLDKIHDIWKLLQPKDVREASNLRISDPFIKKWDESEGFQGLKKYAMTSEDKELEVKIAIVEKYNVRIPELVQKIKASHASNMEFADYLIGTVHQAKGLEFDTVLVAEDFVKVPCAKHNLQRLPQFSPAVYAEDEWNLLYVAVTRAKTCLLMTKSLEYVLTLAGEYLLRAELTSEILKDGPVKCSVPQCNNSVPAESFLTMKKQPLTYSNGTQDPGGFLCHSCVRQRLGPFTLLTVSPSIVQAMDVAMEVIDVPRHIAVLYELF
ncbi:PREDICTED: F-box DNA helicase 1 [Gavialis gangeticus]|uniref:F-box DNA helicase 1 n=1 Tax=Gavialis gangeticus TaxID=94835 RepID=UPI00092F424C|nr:PREDICTED: F-box DNA helicase 1 [Gavialis gangeticus]